MTRAGRGADRVQDILSPKLGTIDSSTEDAPFPLLVSSIDSQWPLPMWLPVSPATQIMRFFLATLAFDARSK